jgi:hypothetical protein
MAPAHAKNHCRADILVCWWRNFPVPLRATGKSPQSRHAGLESLRYSSNWHSTSILDYVAKTVAEDDSLQSPSRNSMFDVGCWMFDVSHRVRLKAFYAAFILQPSTRPAGGFCIHPSSFFLFYCFPLTRASTTCGSARVDVSPIWSTAFSAILRKMRRMILPERVFGRPGAN